MATLRARVAAAAGTPPLSTAGAAALAELEHELRDAESLEDLPGKWQAAILSAELRETLDGGSCHRDGPR